MKFLFYMCTCITLKHYVIMYNTNNNGVYNGKCSAWEIYVLVCVFYLTIIIYVEELHTHVRMYYVKVTYSVL